MWKWLLLSAALILVLLGIALFGSRTVVLTSGGGVVARATEPPGPPWSDRLVTISVGGSNVFGLWKDFFDCPMFVYSFPNARRFLCVYDYDIAILTFVVDCQGASTNTAIQRDWPSDDFTRGELVRGVTNVVVSGNGVVRLPTYAEVQEVSTKVKTWTPRQFKAGIAGLKPFQQFRNGHCT